MNSVKSVLDNFESLILTRLDNKKNKFILEATLNYIKNSEKLSGSLFE